MFASLSLRQADLATHVEWIEIHFDIYIYIRVFRVIRVIRVIMLIIVIMVLKVNYYQSAFNSQKEKLNILA